MYKLLLTFRYLRRKLIPVFALLAVMLCTAMVIIVISVMGGFLDMVKSAGRTLMGDVSIYSGLGGFPHYEKLIEQMLELPEVEAATPVVVAYGLLKLPFETVQTVQVLGIDGQGVDRVTKYRDTLFWTRQRLPEHPQVEELYREHDPVAAALEMRPPWPGAAELPAMVPGIEVSPGNTRDMEGRYHFLPSIIARSVTLTILPVTQRGEPVTTPSTGQFFVVNEFNSGVYDVDSSRVFIPFEVAQRMMLMEPARRLMRNPDGTPMLNPDGTVRYSEDSTPGRCTEIHVRAAAGVSPDALREAVVALYDRFVRSHPELPPRPYMTIATWQQRQAKFLAAVENEKGLMAFLFGIISVVAVVMVGVVFYMIVLEKTRDIGVLRAIGASQPGIAAIFLSFGAVIGALGASLGTALAYLVVTRINEIHSWLGDGLGISVFVVGLPLAGVALYGLPAAAHALIASIFDAGRRTVCGLMAGIGAVLGMLIGGVIVLGEPVWLGEGLGARLGVIGAAAAIGALVMAAVDVQYWLVDIAGRSRRRTVRVGVMTAIGAGLGLLVMLGMLMSMADLPARLNEAMSVQIWDRSVYFFDRIPSRVDWNEVGVIVAVAVVASVLGALIPASKAAMVDPIESLRYE